MKGAINPLFCYNLQSKTWVGVRKIMSAPFYVLCCAFLLTLILTHLFGFLYFSINHRSNDKGDICVLVSMISTSMPAFLLASFIYVFSQGGSNVAQFSLHRHELWSFWFSIYLPFFGFSIVAALLALVALVMELQPRKPPYALLCRLAAVLSFLPTFYLLLTALPDA